MPHPTVAFDVNGGLYVENHSFLQCVLRLGVNLGDAVSAHGRKAHPMPGPVLEIQPEPGFLNNFSRGGINLGGSIVRKAASRAAKTAAYIFSCC